MDGLGADALLLRRLTISTASARGAREADDDAACCSATAAVAAAAASSRRASGGAGVPTPGPVARKRSFVRPGGVGAAWARCVGTQRTVSVGRKRAVGDLEPRGEGAEEGAAALQLPAPAAPLFPRHLPDMAVFLRHRKRCAPRPGCPARPG
jgi:hypothetical protein